MGILIKIAMVAAGGAAIGLFAKWAGKKVTS